MSDSIKDDDEKFNKLAGKQLTHINYEVHSRPSDDVVEKDDKKLEDLLFLQMESQELPKHVSLEEKYEEEILIDEMTKHIVERFEKHKESSFEEFFKKTEDEQ